MIADPQTDFDGCRRACRQAAAHTLVWGECEHGVQPEPTVNLSRVYTAADGYPSIGFDSYTVQQLADLVEPALRRVAVRLGPNALAMLHRGETVALSGGEYADLARVAAHAIVHRNDEQPAAAPVTVPPTDRAGLRELIAGALSEARRPGLGGMTEADAVAYMAGAVMKVLPALVDRGAVLREATDELDAHAAQLADTSDGPAAFVAKARTRAATEWRVAAALLRRMADEPQRCGCGEPSTPGTVHRTDGPCYVDETPQPETQATAEPWLTDSARIGRTLIWSWADVGKGAFREGYRAAQAEARALLGGERGTDQQPETRDAPVYAIPLPGSNGISTCCGRPPCEFVGERVTRDPAKVTCPAPAVTLPGKEA